MITRQILILILTACQLAFGQDFMISNVDIFDGEELLEDSSLVVKDGLIAKIGKDLEFVGEVIDGQGGFLMPGMTNCHVHAYLPASLTEAAQAGVLNLLDMHGMETFQKIIANGNENTLNARFYYAGYAATAPEGHGTQFGFPVPTLTAADQAGEFVQNRLDAGASYIKIIVEPWRATLNHDIVAALIASAHKKHTRAVVHVSHQKDADSVLRADADGLVHIWRDQQMPKVRLQALVKDKNFFVIPTLLTTILAHKQFRAGGATGDLLTDQQLLDEVKRLYDAGVPILAGTDPPNLEINYGSDLYKELQLLSDAGLPALEVLKTATSNPAKYFGLEGTGYLKEGMKADLVWFAESPLTDMKNLNKNIKVWKAGQLIPREK